MINKVTEETKKRRTSGKDGAPTYVKKQPVFHLPLKPNEIMVSRHKHFSIYTKRIHKLFFTQEKTQGQLSNVFDTVYVQGMSACVQRATDLALEVEETYADIHIEDV